MKLEMMMTNAPKERQTVLTGMIRGKGDTRAQTLLTKGACLTLGEAARLRFLQGKLKGGK